MKRYFGYRLFGCIMPFEDFPKVVVFGNVLLDQTIDIRNDERIVEKYNLPVNRKAEVDAKILTQLTADICERLECRENPGGSGLNTVRFLKKLGVDATFCGAVGDDTAAKKLRKILKKQEVDARLETIHDQPTGQCVCLLRSEGESWYADIGASQHFTISYLKENEKSIGLISKQRQIIYIEGFFLTKREAVCNFILHNYLKEGKRLALNLSAPYIIKEYSEKLLQLAKHAYLIFGNEEEFETLATLTRQSSVESLAKTIMSWSTVPKIILMTKGAQGVTVISNYESEETRTHEICYQSFKAPRVHDVVDTTGAGDAFVAGFLQAWLQNRQLSECVRKACDVAASVVTQIGAQLPEN